MGKELWIGIDVGGSHMAAGLVDSVGRLLARTQVKTPRPAIVDETLDLMATAVKDTLRTAGYSLEDVKGIGAGFPGGIDTEKGIVTLAPNLGWRNEPVASKLRELLGRPVVIDNDANAAVAGEAFTGAGKGKKHILMITLGTGIGGGLFLNGELYRGFTGFAGEVGHIVIDPEGPLCACGQKGCFETFGAGPAIATRAEKYLLETNGSLLHKWRKEGAGRLSVKMIFDAARMGDEVALEVAKETGEYIGIGLSSLLNLINPEIVVIGGSISRAGEVLLQPIRESIAKHALVGVKGTPVVQAALGNDAGVIGAAAIAMRM